jgi:hypothetical protein
MLATVETPLASNGSIDRHAAVAEITGHNKDNNMNRELATAGMLATVETPLTSNGSIDHHAAAA